ncbi:MAG: site-specific DNA-methyltransferase [Armatimonadetes bacterium]|nr:site-specific DNA-methyltransferase [Armatimonadota bacterium]
MVALDWPGKADCLAAARAEPLGELVACPGESVAFDTSQNQIIEGDNLEVLKHLQRTHAGQVKLIYIDPPYNTGHDFVYSDRRSHARWLDMMAPRLSLARALLTADGIIAISIDDNEMAHLRLLMNEIFGEERFLGVVVVQSNRRGQTYRQISKSHEYLLFYARQDATLRELERVENPLPYADALGPFDLWELRNRNPRFGRHNRPNLYFPIYVAPQDVDDIGCAKIALAPDVRFSLEVWPRNRAGADGCWRWSRDLLRTVELDGACPVVVARQRRDGGWNVYEKSRKNTTRAKSLWTETGMINELGTVELGTLGMGGCYDHPKPLGLLRKIIRICTDGDDLVLDFFAGSGTTGHALLAANREEGTGRRFILVQWPEPLDPAGKPAAFCDALGKPRTISEITRERVRRALAETGSTEGFRAYRLSGPRRKSS